MNKKRRRKYVPPCWLNMILTHVLDAEISYRSNGEHLDILQNLRTFIEDKIIEIGGEFTDRVHELMNVIDKLVKRARRKKMSAQLARFG